VSLTQKTQMGCAPEQLHRLLDVLIGSMDDRVDGEELARRAHFERHYFNHLVKATLGESPAAFRRRLLLERAAYRLASTDQSVTVVAFEAGYGSVESFTHAFRRAFGLPPADYRAQTSFDFRLDAPNGVHYVPPEGSTPAGGGSRRRTMDLTDRLVDHDNWLTDRLLVAASQLTDPELDEPIVLSPPSVAFNNPAPSLREMLDRLVLAKEMWIASIAGHEAAPSSDTSILGMRLRLRGAGAAFAELVSDIRQRNAWDTAYVDATQRPPHTNTFGASIAHVLAWDAARREIVAGALTDRGIDLISLDPIQWELGPDDLDDLADRSPALAGSVTP